MMGEKISNLLKRPFNGIKIYFLSFVIYFFPMFLNETTFTGTIGNRPLRIISYVSIVFLLFKIYVLDNWNKKELFIISMLLFLSLCTWRTTHDVQLLNVTPFVIGSKNVNFKEIIKWYVYLCFVFILGTIIFSLLGIIPNLIYYSSTRPTRFGMGMSYPSQIASHYMFLVLAYCYLRFTKMNYLDYISILVGDCICLILTNTRLDFIAVVLVIPIMIITQRAFKEYKLSSLIVSFFWMAIPILSFITIFVSFFYNASNHIMNKLNILFSNRLYLGHVAFTKYHVNFLGRTVVEHSYSGISGLKFANNEKMTNIHYFYIDSSYIRMILLWGLIMFILIICCLTFIAVRSTFYGTYILSSIIFITAVNFMFEPNILNLIYNPFLLALLAKPYYLKIKEQGNNEK